MRDTGKFLASALETKWPLEHVDRAENELGGKK